MTANKTTFRRIAGFTLMELLAVILIMAVLLGIMTQAAQMVIRVARGKRLVMTQRTLETALARYRDEYGEWPMPASATPVGPTGDDRFRYVVQGENNKDWFDKLREDSDDNPRNIRFLDETTIFTIKDGKPVPLHKAEDAPYNLSPPHPIVGIKRNRDPVYFKITINTDKDTVLITTP